MNTAIFIGNLTKDPVLRATAGGGAVCTFTVAVQRRFADANGERRADFLPVVCWRSLAESCGKHLYKGSKVCVAGAIQTRTYEAKDGTKRHVTEILANEVDFLPGARQQEGGWPEHAEQLPFSPRLSKTFKLTK